MRARQGKRRCKCAPCSTSVVHHGSRRQRHHEVTIGNFSVAQVNANDDARADVASAGTILLSRFALSFAAVSGASMLGQRHVTRPLSWKDVALADLMRGQCG